MRSVIFSVAAILGLAAVGLTTYQANAQGKPPKQDCEQQPGIQSSTLNQDQSCNTVFSDPDLLVASTGELIQRLVNASPSLPDGPFVRVDLDPAVVPNHLDYLTVSTSVSAAAGGNDVEFPAAGNDGSIESQIGFDPGVTITAHYELSGDTITISDTTINGNQILNGCPDGVALIKNGGKNQTVTMIGDIDMWRDNAGSEVCGLKFTAEHTINVLVLFYAVGPAGFVSTGDIAGACAAVNDNLANQQAPVAFLTGGYPETGTGIPQPTNLTGCFGEAFYCDSGEAAGLRTACFPTGLNVSGSARAVTAVASGGPPAPPPAPGLGVALQAIQGASGNDQTTTFGGGEGGGSLITCCSFPSF